VGVAGVGVVVDVAPVGVDAVTVLAAEGGAAE